MPFVPGKSGNPSGRKKGNRNKSTAITKDLITELLSDEAQNLPSLLDQLSPKDRVFFFTRLAAIILPRPTDNEASTISFNKIKILPNFLSIDE